MFRSCAVFFQLHVLLHNISGLHVFFYTGSGRSAASVVEVVFLWMWPRQRSRTSLDVSSVSSTPAGCRISLFIFCSLSEMCISHVIIITPVRISPKSSLYFASLLGILISCLRTYFLAIFRRSICFCSWRLESLLSTAMSPFSHTVLLDLCYIVLVHFCGYFLRIVLLSFLFLYCDLWGFFGLLHVPFLLQLRIQLC